MTLNKVIEIFRLEQGNTEAQLSQLASDSLIKKKISSLTKDEGLLNLVTTYKKENLKEFIEGVSNLMGNQKKEYLNEKN